MINSYYSSDAPEAKTMPVASTVKIYQEIDEEPTTKNPYLSRFAKGITYIFAITSSTVIPDPWALEKKRRNAAITSSIYEEIAQSRISRKEALKIAVSILLNAEKERIIRAEEEAKYGIMWDE